MKEAVNERRKNPAKGGEYLLIDALLESDLSEQVIIADAVSFLIGGFHTTGLSKYCLN